MYEAARRASLRGIADPSQLLETDDRPWNS